MALIVLTVGGFIVPAIAALLALAGVARSSAWTPTEKVVAAGIVVALVGLPFVLLNFASSAIGEAAIGLVLFWYAAGPVAAVYLVGSRRFRMWRSSRVTSADADLTPMSDHPSSQELTPDEIVPVVQRWFRATKLAHLDLPGRTLGRPGDEFFELSSISRRGEAISVSLGDRHELTLWRPHVAVAEREVTFRSSAEISLRIRRAGEDDWSEEWLNPGTVRLWEYPPVPHIAPEPWQILT